MDPNKRNVVDAPENRLQGEQETGLVVDANSTTTPPNSFSIKNSKAQGSVLKQEAAASVIAKGNGGELLGGGESVMAFQRNLRPGQYSGDVAGYLGSAAGTPTAEKPYQGDSRVDKRISDANKEINFRASEQYATEFQHIPYLRESKSTVGANGNPQNVAARSQKKSGLVPQALLFDRSLDELRHCSFIATAGQTVKEEGVQYRDYPEKYEKRAPNGSYALSDMTAEQKQYFARGNFSPRYIKASFNKSGNNAYLSGFEVIEDDWSVTTDYETVNDAADNFKVALNRAEVSRQNIDSKHGSPEMDKYSPLGRSVMTGPTSTVTYLRDVESTAGAICASALRFANKARAYFLSRTAKDGQLNKAPGIDALYGHLVRSSDYTTLLAQLGLNESEDAIKGSVFDSPIGCAAGSAFTLIKIFDSVSKYNTKGDLVNQPRGLKFVLQTGMNNHMPLRVEQNFLKALNAVDVFSTIDREYDPSSVVCIEDGIRYILPYSWRHRLKFTRTSLGGPRIYDEDEDILFSYGYQAGEGNQRYIVKVGEPVLNGIAWFLEQHANKIFNAVRSDVNADKAVWYIPVASHTTHFSLWDLLVSASMAYIDYERTNSLKDIIDLDVWGDYPFTDFVNVSKDDILTPANYGKIDELKELSVGKMRPTTAMRWIFPELFSQVKDGNNSGLLLPWYESQRNYHHNEQDKMSRNDRHNFTTPILRSGVKLKFLDDFFSMEAIDQLFAIDKLSEYPFKREQFNAMAYKYDLQSDGLVMVRSSSSDWKTEDIMKCARQLGWIFPAFNGQVWNERSLGSFDEDGIEAYEENRMFSSENDVRVGSAYRLRMYKGINAQPVTNLFNPSDQTVDRGQAFSQNWYDMYTSYGFIANASFDVPVGYSNAFNNNLTALENVTAFAPYLRRDPYVEDGVLHVDNAGFDNFKMISFARVLWARIQKLPCILSPFDNQEASNGYVDPYDFAYLFGLAGFLAANYDEELQNREAVAMSEQFGYIDSYYLNKSLLYK